MRFYTRQHRHTCGIDLHARTMHLCILEQNGDKLLHRNLDADARSLPPSHRSLPRRPGRRRRVHVRLVLARRPLRRARSIPFVLGHALYMKAIHGGKAKNDDRLPHKIAALLRGGNFPMAYVYPKGHARDPRPAPPPPVPGPQARRADRPPAQPNSQYNLPPFGKKLLYAKNREAEHRRALQRPQRRQELSRSTCDLIDHFDELIADVELYLERTVKVGSTPATLLSLRRSPASARSSAWCCSTRSTTSAASPSAGEFLSYARLVRAARDRRQARAAAAPRSATPT